MSDQAVIDYWEQTAYSGDSIPIGLEDAKVPEMNDFTIAYWETAYE